jgi:glycosyltransferase involved in cell wall biosynthesis
MPAPAAPTISVGIPLYNAEKYVQGALDAIAAQTFRDFEVVISDNASTDQTYDICREFAAKDPRFRIVRNGTNLGASKNFNRVFELSNAPFFRWAAYDDLMGPRALEVCLAALQQNPDAVLAYPKSIIIDDDGRETEKYDDLYAFGEETGYERFRHFLKIVELRNCHPVFGLIRREALLQTPLLGNYHSADKVLLAQLVMLGKFIEVPDYQFYRRYHAMGSVRVNKTAMDYAAWFDTARTGKTAYPRLRRAIELVKSIARAPMSPGRKMQCVLFLAAFYVRKEQRQKVWSKLTGRIIRPSAVDSRRKQTDPREPLLGGGWDVKK